MANEVNQAGSLERKEDLGNLPESIARRWKLELKLADKRESNWRKRASDIYKLYTPETPATNSFNILWTNTETLRQSVYNSLPQPDVRRRYQDDDQLGKSVGEVLTRALEFSQDTYDFDGLLQKDVLSMLLAGRAISRVRYVPDIRSIGGEDSHDDDDSQESDTYEEIGWEQAICERIQFDDFRILCAAKTWDEVTAIGFRHRFTREDCIEKFGEEVGNKIPLDEVADEDVKKSKDVQDLFKTAEVWEIWDKEEKEVLFICPTYAAPCKVQDDPLGLQGFFPIPRPLYAIENDTTLVPAALYTQYEQQAKELNRISLRINKLIEGLKNRGIYDSTLSELSELMKAGDNELIPAQNVTALLERGGLEKAIWMIPIDTAAMVLKELYAQRDATKQVIYEITGISDIMRSASDPNETFGAQKIKTQWGTQRLQRMQREVQRYIRDLIRLKAEIIAEKFQMETLQQMTLVNLPTEQQVAQQFQQAQMQWQQQAMQAQQQGQQPPPQPQFPQVVTWEAVMEAMHNDATRTYRIDIETDSTLAATQDADMSGLRDLLGGITQFIQGVGPAVQSGAVPMEAVKAIIGVVTRRARMGTVVEDALEKFQQPAPQGDPEAAKAQAQQQQQQAQMQHEQQMQQSKDQATAQMEQFKAQIQDQQHQRQLQADLQAKQTEAQFSMQLEQHKQEAQAQQIAHQNQLESEREMQRQALEAQVKERELAYKAQSEADRLEFERWKAELEANTKVVVAEMAAKTSLKQASISANSKEGLTELDEAGDEKPNSALSGLVDALNANMARLMDVQARNHEVLVGKQENLIAQVMRPRAVVRGSDGKMIGVQ
jgi:hypothetical protein